MGVATVMPLGSPIGTNRGLKTRDSVQIIVEQAEVPVVVDAGLGAPSHAAEAMELGADAVLVNTAIAIARAGGQLMELKIKGEKRPRMVLARDEQYDVISGALLHADLYEVDMTETIQVDVPLSIVGETSLVETNQAMLLQVLNEVQIECLPDEGNNPAEIEWFHCLDNRCGTMGSVIVIKYFIDNSCP